jgi:hypothetical protein
MLATFFFCLFKTRREYKKRPIKAFSRFGRREKKLSRVEPHQRRSTSIISATEKNADYGVPAMTMMEKKRNDTLV